MVPHFMAHFRLMLLATASVIFCTPLAAASAQEKIEQGWREFRFLSLELAEQAFQEALELELTPEQVVEAKMGLAMSLQYPESGRDLQKAEAIYRDILSMDPAVEVQALLSSNLADLHLARGETDQALALFNELINTSLNSVIGQDALRRKIHLEGGPYGSETSRRMADEAAERIRDLEWTRERPRLLPVLHDQIGLMYFWLGAYEEAAYHFEQMTLIGSAETTSYGSQSSMLYRLAKLYENELNDAAKAGHFYRRLIVEYPNSNMAYYSLEQAVALGSISREEVQTLNLSGMTADILDDLFSTADRGGR